MARPPGVWYWGARKGWYTTVGGKQVRLTIGPEAGTKSEARRALYRLLADGGRRPRDAPPPLSCRELIGLFLGDYAARVARGERKAITLEGYVRFLRPAAAALGDAPAGALAPHRAKAWAEGRGWGPTTVYNALTAVKAAWSWGKKLGHLEADPLAALERPRPRRREAVMDAGQFAAVLGTVADPAFRELLVALRLTGARPGELARLTAADCDPARGVAVLRRHKTEGDAGRPRVILLPAGAAELVARRTAEFPEGPIFRNTKGRPWTRNAMACRFARIRARLGYGGEVTAYSLRHQFATDGLAAGVPIAVMADLLGHSGTAMVSRHYSHLRERLGYLLAAAELAADSGHNSPAARAAASTESAASRPEAAGEARRPRRRRAGGGKGETSGAAGA
jgi:integrase